MKLQDFEFLEPHEREELERFLKSRPEKMKRLRTLLTHGPLKWFWRAAGWVVFANLFLLGAVVAFGQDPNWLHDDLGVLLVALLFTFGICVIAWYVNEAERKEKEQQKEKYEELEKKLTNRW